MARSRLTALVAVFLLGACASQIDSSFENITLKTPGTDHARCKASNSMMVWQLESNQTTKISRNDSDLKIDCYAPGNREAHVIIDRDLNPWALVNVVTGIVPGVLYDHFSGGLYDYPDVITIDMGPARPYDKPEYELADAPSTALQKIEDYGPSIAKREGDKYYVRPGVHQMEVSEILANSHPLASGSRAQPVSSYGGQ